MKVLGKSLSEAAGDYWQLQVDSLSDTCEAIWFAIQKRKKRRLPRGSGCGTRVRCEVTMLERFFRLSQNQTSARVEVLARR